MFKVENNAITITRGDSGIAEITLTTEAGEQYTPQEGDSIHFYAKPNKFTLKMTEFVAAEPVIEKTIPITDLNNRDQRNVQQRRVDHISCMNYTEAEPHERLMPGWWCV